MSAKLFENLDGRKLANLSVVLQIVAVGALILFGGISFYLVQNGYVMVNGKVDVARMNLYSIWSYRFLKIGVAICGWVGLLGWITTAFALLLARYRERWYLATCVGFSIAWVLVAMVFYTELVIKMLGNRPISFF